MVVAGATALVSIATLECDGDQCAGQGIGGIVLGSIGAVLIIPGTVALIVGGRNARRERRERDALLLPTVACGREGAMFGLSLSL